MTAKARILIVDDIAVNIDILRRILRKDYHLEFAASGEECLAKLPDFKPQLVLLDIMMPGIDGYETCRRIKSSAVGSFVQVLLVSGKGSPAERVQGYEAQADDYIVKPFNHDELLSKVRVHVRLGDSQRQLSAAKEELQLYADSLEKLVEQRTRQWTATQDMTVFALARLTDSRNTDTGEHVLRMRTMRKPWRQTLLRMDRTRILSTTTSSAICTAPARCTTSARSPCPTRSCKSPGRSPPPSSRS